MVVVRSVNKDNFLHLHDVSGFEVELKKKSDCVGTSAVVCRFGKTTPLPALQSACKENDSKE